MKTLKRIVVHFPGFEPLDAARHRERYARSAAGSGKVWNCHFQTGALENGRFAVHGSGQGWQVESEIHVCDHDALISGLRRPGLLRQLLLGFQAGLRVVTEGGMAGYFRHAWRFALFFIFPFLFILLALDLAVLIAALPWLFGLPAWHYLWSLPAGVLFFTHGFIPFSNRLHTLHLLADWRLAVHGARLDDAERSEERRVGKEC